LLLLLLLLLLLYELLFGGTLLLLFDYYYHLNKIFVVEVQNYSDFVDYFDSWIDNSYVVVVVGLMMVVVDYNLNYYNLD
jgi:hypothetical protein